MLIDDHIRKEAIQIDQSFIVQAPAGSGKTSLLVQRFINLLAVCNDPEECLAITFTKKAAFEMRNRVLQAIEQQNLIKNLNNTNNIYIKILANPNRLKVLTIDAFCASLTQKMPILSNGINLTIAEDPKKLYLAAVDQLLKTAYKSKELSSNLLNLLKYLANDHKAIKNLLIDMLAKREQWLPLIVPIKANVNLKTVLEKNLKTAIEDLLADLLTYLPKSDCRNKIIHIAKQAANNLRISNIENNIIFCQKLNNSWPQATVFDLPIWRGLTELLFNKDGTVRRKVNTNQGFLAVNCLKNSEEKKVAAEFKKSMQELLQYLVEHEKIFLKKLQQVIILPNQYYYAMEDWNFLQSLLYMLPELVAHLIVIFQENQQVDFPQVAIKALQALGTEQEPTDIALFMDYKLNHILVDEFQDTSVLQFNLLEKLVANWIEGDGKTIFLVGDPMQSIYRFRQANVGLFLRAQEYGIANIKLKKLYLTTNFRASVTLVNNLNKLFTKIFPEQSDMILGGICYSPVNHILKVEQTISNVEFFLTENNQLEAESIVELIKKIRKNSVNNHSIAILVRSRVHANIIIPTLRYHDIKFQANDMELLINQGIICDLITLTRAILHVHDVVAWLSLLRSPLVGLKLADLHVLRECSLNPLFTQLQDYKNNQQLSSDAKLRLSYVLPILFNAIEQKESVINLSKLIKKSWVALGGMLLLRSPDLELVESFFLRLLKLTNINSVDVVEELINEQFVSTSQTNIDLDSIQVMTIHKAKGLEFDTVILPGLAKKTLTSKPQLLLWDERFHKILNKNYLMVAPIRSANLVKHNYNNSIYDFIKCADDQRELYEEQRLLYVAMTRSRKNFYGFSHKRTAENGKSFFAFLEPYITLEQPPYRSKGGNGYFINEQIILHRIPSSWYVSQINHGTGHHIEM